MVSRLIVFIMMLYCHLEDVYQQPSVARQMVRRLSHKCGFRDLCCKDSLDHCYACSNSCVGWSNTEFLAFTNSGCDSGCIQDMSHPCYAVDPTYKIEKCDITASGSDPTVSLTTNTGT